MTERLSKLASPAVLVVLVIIFYWPLSLTAQYEWMWAFDLAQQVLPWYEEEARQFQSATLPTWDPHEWGGQPLLAQGQPGVAYPLNWVLFLMPRENRHIRPVVLAWYFIAIHIMAALFCYLLCRDLGVSRFGSIIGGLIFALAAYVGTVWWPQMINGGVWAPLIFLFLLRAVGGGWGLRSAALCGLTWGMAWLSGHHQAPMFISLAVGFTWLAFIVRRRSWRLAGYAGIAIAFMFATAALQLLPAREYGHLAKRWVSAPEPVTWNQPVPYSIHSMFSLSPLSVFGIVIPGLGGSTDPFIGIVACALALLAVATAWHKSEVKLFVALAVGGFVYALGSHDVFQGILYAVVPLLNMARTPSMALIVFSLGAAVLAAYGIDELTRLRKSVVVFRASFAMIGAGLIMGALMLAVFLSNNKVDERPAATAIIAVVAGALLFAWNRLSVASRTAAVVVTGLLLIELNADAPVLASRDDAARMADLNHIRGDRDLVDFLNRQPRPFRVDMETDELPVSWPAYNNFDEIKASSASITVNRTNTEFWTPQNRSLNNVRFTIGRTTSMPDAKEVFTGASGMKVFENPHAFPRAWAVHELERVSSTPQGQALIRDHLEELHSKAFVLGGAGQSLAPCAATDTVEVTRYEPNVVSIRAQMACDGIVVLSDTFYPGWNATVDGRPAQVLEVNLTMRGVAVGKGTHVVEYRYRPASVYIGGALTALGILGASLIALFTR